MQESEDVHTVKIKPFVEYKHDKVLQSRIVHLTLMRHHQGYLDFDF